MYYTTIQTAVRMQRTAYNATLNVLYEKFCLLVAPTGNLLQFLHTFIDHFKPSTSKRQADTNLQRRRVAGGVVPLGAGGEQLLLQRGLQRRERGRAAQVVQVAHQRSAERRVQRAQAGAEARRDGSWRV